MAVLKQTLDMYSSLHIAGYKLQYHYDCSK